MTIKFRAMNFDEEDNYLSFRIYGPQTSGGTVAEVIIETTISEWGTAANWLSNNQTEAQTLIDNSTITNSFTVLQEARNFLADNPGAIQLIKLPPDDLEAAIENRSAAQETLLLKTLSFAVRLFYSERGE